VGVKSVEVVVAVSWVMVVFGVMVVKPYVCKDLVWCWDRREACRMLSLMAGSYW
jgi:hypothetical protein